MGWEGLWWREAWDAEKIPAQWRTDNEGKLYCKVISINVGLVY